MGRPRVDPVLRFWSRVRKSEECWEWTGPRIRGYGVMGIGDKHLRVHRYSWELHFGPIPDGLFVCHRCDNPPCVRPDHLFLGDARDNARDAHDKGRLAAGDRHWMRQHPERVRRGNDNVSRVYRDRLIRGEDHPKARLTEVQVHEVRRLIASGQSIRSIAMRFGVSRFAIQCIRSGVSWGWLPVEDAA